MSLVPESPPGFLVLPLGLTVEEIKKRYIERTLMLHRGNRAEASRSLGVSRRSMYNFELPPGCGDPPADPDHLSVLEAAAFLGLRTRGSFWKLRRRRRELDALPFRTGWGPRPGWSRRALRAWLDAGLPPTPYLPDQPGDAP